MIPFEHAAEMLRPAVLAHQGGWDEFLMVAAPVGVFAALLYGANRRAQRLADRRADGEPDPAPPPRNEHAGPI
jgi:hypothetical protein